MEASYCPFNRWTSSREAVNTIFIVFGLTQPGIEAKSFVWVADALSTRPLIGLIFFSFSFLYEMRTKGAFSKIVSEKIKINEPPQELRHKSLMIAYLQNIAA